MGAEQLGSLCSRSVCSPGERQTADRSSGISECPRGAVADRVIREGLSKEGTSRLILNKKAGSAKASEECPRQWEQRVPRPPRGDQLVGLESWSEDLVLSTLGLTSVLLSSSQLSSTARPSHLLCISGWRTLVCCWPTPAAAEVQKQGYRETGRNPILLVPSLRFGSLAEVIFM